MREQKDDQDIIARATHRLREDPHDVLPLIARAEAFMEQRDVRSALQDAERCLEIVWGDPGIQGEMRAILLAQLYTLQSRALAGLGDWEHAYRAVQQALHERADYVKAIVQRGCVRREVSDLQGALQDFDRALVLDSNSAIAYMERGVARYCLGDYQGAIEDYDEVIQLDQTLAAAWSNRGQAHFALNSSYQAERDSRTALQIDPQLIPAYDILAGSLCQQRRIDEAWDVVAEGLRYRPGDVALRIRAARIYVEQDLFLQALAVLNMILRRSPDHGEAYGLRGSVHLRLGDDAAAIVDLRRAIQLDCQRVAHYSNLALAYLHTGDLTATLDCLRQVLRLEPDNVEARSLYARLTRGEQTRDTDEPSADNELDDPNSPGTQEGSR